MAQGYRHQAALIKKRQKTKPKAEKAPGKKASKKLPKKAPGKAARKEKNQAEATRLKVHGPGLVAMGVSKNSETQTC